MTEYRKIAKDASKEGCASGCGHGVIAVAAAILLGGGATYWRFPGWLVFVVVVVAVFFASVLLPWKKGKGE
jgi:hypothetical protein